MRYLTICTLTALAFMASAQTPYLVKDLNTTYSSDTKSSTPVEFTAFGNRIYFVATTDASGTELWSTDGTSAGTSIVSDIVAGTASSSPNTLRVVNGALLLNARDANHGIELWATDGTAAGTHLLKDINPGPSSGQPVFQTLFKNKIYFSADDGSNGRELWVTDGTVSGTRMFKDIEPGSASSFPSSFVVMGNTLYFRASSALWKTDGTDAGTVKVSTVSPLDIVVAGSRLFFTGFTQASGWELWTSDGTDAGTQMVTEIRPGPASAFDSNYALGEFIVEGIKTTIPIHREIMQNSAFIEGRVDTTFIERTWLQQKN